MPSISDIITQHRPSLDSYEALYKHFHAHPELPTLEKETAARIATELELLRQKYALSPTELVVNTGIGGHGIAATFRNGDGQTVLLRADFDALPVEEKTGLDYASKVRMEDKDGVEQPVMHACGHDMHVAALLGAAETLFAARDAWAGAVVFCFQPAEEIGVGARAMVDGGLYSKELAPIPDVVLGAHVFFNKTGTLGTRSKAVMSCADSLKITLHGRGGHASMPHRTCDPVTLAAYIVTRLQSIVSREIPPSVAASVTVASLRAGGAENVIPATAEMKLNVRTWSEETRADVLARIRRIVDAECEAHGAPAPATYETLSAFPLTYNDETATARLCGGMEAHFGDAWSTDLQPAGGSEDFSILATAVGRPSVYFVYGGTGEEVWRRMVEEGVDVPINHSPFFAPVLQPTLKNGVEGYVVGVLTWLGKS